MKKINKCIGFFLLIGVITSFFAFMLSSCNYDVKEFIERGFSKPRFTATPVFSPFLVSSIETGSKTCLPSNQDINLFLTIKNEYKLELKAECSVPSNKENFFNKAPYVKSIDNGNLNVSFNFKDTAEPSSSNNFLGEVVPIEIKLFESKTNRFLESKVVEAICNSPPPALTNVTYIYSPHQDEFKVHLPKNSGMHQDLSKVKIKISTEYGGSEKKEELISIAEPSEQDIDEIINLRGSGKWALPNRLGARRISLVVFDKAGLSSVEEYKEGILNIENISLTPALQESMYELSASMSKNPGVPTPIFADLKYFYGEKRYWEERGFIVTCEATGFTHTPNDSFIKNTANHGIGNYNVNVKLKQNGKSEERLASYTVNITSLYEVSVEWENYLSVGCGYTSGKIEQIKYGEGIARPVAPPLTQSNVNEIFRDSTVIFTLEGFNSATHEIVGWKVNGATITSSNSNIILQDDNKKLVITRVSSNMKVSVETKKKQFHIKWELQDSAGASFNTSGAKVGANIGGRNFPLSTMPQDKIAYATETAELTWTCPANWELKDIIVNMVSNASNPSGITSQGVSIDETNNKLTITNITSEKNIIFVFEELKVAKFKATWENGATYGKLEIKKRAKANSPAKDENILSVKSGQDVEIRVKGEETFDLKVTGLDPKEKVIGWRKKSADGSYQNLRSTPWVQDGFYNNNITDLKLKGNEAIEVIISTVVKLNFDVKEENGNDDCSDDYEIVAKLSSPPSSLVKSLILPLGADNIPNSPVKITKSNPSGKRAVYVVKGNKIDVKLNGLPVSTPTSEPYKTKVIWRWEGLVGAPVIQKWNSKIDPERHDSLFGNNEINGHKCDEDLNLKAIIGPHRMIINISVSYFSTAEFNNAKLKCHYKPPKTSEENSKNLIGNGNNIAGEHGTYAGQTTILEITNEYPNPEKITYKFEPELIVPPLITPDKKKVIIKLQTINGNSVNIKVVKND